MRSPTTRHAVPRSPEKTHSKRWAIIIAALWTLVVAVSMSWNLFLITENIQTRAHSQASAALDKDLAYRHLVSDVGGFYVPLGKGIEPNPYMSHLPHRDITTTDGQQLTLVNSSYFVRLVHDQEAIAGQGRPKGHVTSQYPLREKNKPDAWESEALKKLSQGKQEVSEVIRQNEEPYLRVMRPRFARQSCFTCHIDSHFKSGDVMGGLSVMIPLDPLHSDANYHLGILGLGHATLWFFGLGAITYGYRRIQRQENHLLHNAYHDELTGLPNRSYLLESLRETIDEALSYSHHGAILLFDLDHFKNINDSLGHPVGDALLQETARRIQSEVHAEAIAARLGGDEFVLFLPKLGIDPEIALIRSRAIATRLQSSLKRVYRVMGYDLHVTPSIGIAIFPEQGESPEELLRHADAAMYQAKSRGRNSVAFYLPSLQMEVDERLALEKDLRHALEHNQLDLYYQPQLNHRGNIVGMEALARWPHPTRGMIPPTEFVAAAEESGLILALGEWVLRSAIHQASEWYQEGLLGDSVTVSVNISAHQFHRHEFALLLRNILYEAQLPARHLKLEMTESVVIDDITNAIEKMRQLQSLGILFSLDDFGTGYSSLSYLKKLPLDQLKIDRTFVRDVPVNSNDAAIVETIIGMAKNLGLSILAEGVENEEQLRFLESNGCFEYQGYFFYHPLPSYEIEPLLRQEHPL